MKHFTLEELVDKATFETEGEAAWLHFDTSALIMLDDLREYFDAPITVNNWHQGGQFQFRGFRSPTYQPGITPGSAHRIGKAFDFDVHGLTAIMSRGMIISHQNDTRLSKIMRLEDHVNWVHADIMSIPEERERIYLFRA